MATLSPKGTLPAYAVMICSTEWSELAGIHAPAPAARPSLFHYPSMCQHTKRKSRQPSWRVPVGDLSGHLLPMLCQNHRMPHPGRVTVAATALQCEVL